MNCDNHDQQADLRGSPGGHALTQARDCETAAPLLTKFRTDAAQYAYDGNTGAILRVDPVTYELLDFFGTRPNDEILSLLATRFRRDEITNALYRLQALSNNSGVFRPIAVKFRMVCPEFVAENWSKMSGTFDHLVLKVSDDCNLRCRYCVYSGAYENQDVYSQSKMPWEVARNAIDIFLQNPAHQIPRTLSFYGGEPLINFELMTSCVEYVRSRDPGVSFSVTTNGTLLCEQVREFLVAHDFRLKVSLDGPREMHDANRLFLGGEGSFESIARHLRALKESAPGYYEKNVIFFCTTSPNTDFRRLLDFFVNTPDLVNPAQIFPSSVAPGHKTYFAPHLQLHGDGKLWRKENLEEMFLQKVVQGDRGDREFAFLRTMFERAYLFVHRRPINLKGWGESFHAMPTCFPGHSKLFVRPDGKLFICEKSNNALEIGDLSTGLDGKKICGIYRAYYNLHNNECRKCWALRFCENCYASNTRETGAFPERLNTEDCDSIRWFWRDKLRKYAAVQEQNPHAFDFLNDATLVWARIPLLDFDPSDPQSHPAIDGREVVGDRHLDGVT